MRWYSIQILVKQYKGVLTILIMGNSSVNKTQETQQHVVYYVRLIAYVALSQAHVVDQRILAQLVEQLKL